VRAIILAAFLVMGSACDDVANQVGTGAVKEVDAERSLLCGPGPGQRGKCAVNLETSEFQLRLGGDWRQVPSSDAELYSFESKTLKTVVVISVLPAAIPREKLLAAANAMADSRRRAEQRVRGGGVHFGDNWVELKENGNAGHVAYAGYDDDGTVFRFMGWATQRKFLSFFVSTETRDNDLSKKIFGEVFEGFKFTIP
jgi:hypothetical protein